MARGLRYTRRRDCAVAQFPEAETHRVTKTASLPQIRSIPMKKSYACLLVATLLVSVAALAAEPLTHPDTTGWKELFAPDLSNTVKPEGVWTVANGELTASKDEAIWSQQEYENFIIDLEFKTADGTNSGVFVYCSNIEESVPNSVEIQIADDFAKKWAESPRTWQCGAIFGRLAPTKSAVKKPGEWNHYTIRCVGKQIDVVLNGENVTSIDMSKWTSAKKNPDGSEIPPWLSKPLSELPTKGHIGFQGKHAGAPIWFRNIKIKTLN